MKKIILIPLMFLFFISYAYGISPQINANESIQLSTSCLSTLNSVAFDSINNGAYIVGEGCLNYYNAETNITEDLTVPEYANGVHYVVYDNITDGAYLIGDDLNTIGLVHYQRASNSTVFLKGTDTGLFDVEPLGL